MQCTFLARPCSLDDLNSFNHIAKKFVERRHNFDDTMMMILQLKRKGPKSISAPEESHEEAELEADELFVYDIENFPTQSSVDDLSTQSQRSTKGDTFKKSRPPEVGTLSSRLATVITDIR